MNQATKLSRGLVIGTRKADGAVASYELQAMLTRFGAIEYFVVALDDVCEVTGAEGAVVAQADTTMGCEAQMQRLVRIEDLKLWRPVWEAMRLEAVPAAVRIVTAKGGV